MTGKVIKVLASERARIVQYGSIENCEKLHVEDLMDCDSVPEFEYSLRIGDKIEFKGYFGNTMTGAFTEIGNSRFRTDTLKMVSTDTGEQLVEKGNERFRVVESKHEDAPPRG